MNLKQLQYFVMVAEAGGFSQASDAAHLAQSALSRHVRLLEEELHARLFDRTGRGVILTEQGEYLLEQAHEILEKVGQAERSLQSWHEHPIGSVRVGMTPTASISCGARLVQELRTQYPDVTLHLSEGISSDLCNRVIDGELDVALVFEEPRSELLRSEHLRDESMCLVTAPGLDLPNPIPLKQLESLNLILSNKHERIRVAVERSCAKAGVGCEPTYKIDAIATIKRLAANGDGVAILTSKSVNTEVLAGLVSVYDLDDPKLALPLYVTHRAKHQLPRAAATAVDTIRRLFTE